MISRVSRKPQIDPALTNSMFIQCLLCPVYSEHIYDMEAERELFVWRKESSKSGKERRREVPGWSCEYKQIIIACIYNNSIIFIGSTQELNLKPIMF